MKKIIFSIFSLFFLCSAVLQFQRTQRAIDTPFDNSTNGFTATEVQSAILEARDTAQNKSRYAISVGFDGNASTGRYLEFNSNVNSNLSGYVNANLAWLREITCVCESTSTITFKIAKVGGSDIGTCTITSARKAITTNLSVSIASLDELTVRVTSGSCSRPIMWLFFQNQ